MPKKRSAKKTILFALMILTIAGYVVMIWGVTKTYLLFDFIKFYASADLYRSGESIYTPIPYNRYFAIPAEELAEVPRETMHPNLNLPVLTLIFLPFTFFNIRTAYILWGLMSVALGVAAVDVIYRQLTADKPDRLLRAVAIILVLLYFPSVAAVWFGQVSFLLFWLLALTWAAWRSGNDRLAGIAMGLALVVKINTGIFLLVFLLERRWRLLAWAAGVFLASNLLGLAIFGLSEHLAYLNVLDQITWYAASWNASLHGFFSRIFGGSENRPLIDLPGLTTGLSLLLSAGLAAALVWAAWPRPGKTQLTRDLVFCLAIVVMLLVSPLGWMYYFMLLLLPVLVIWRAAERSIHKNLYRGLIIFAWVSSTIPHWLVPSKDVTPLVIFFWAGVYTYTLVLFSGVLMAVISECRR